MRIVLLMHTTTRQTAALMACYKMHVTHGDAHLHRSFTADELGVSVQTLRAAATKGLLVDSTRQSSLRGGERAQFRLTQAGWRIAHLATRETAVA